MPMIDSDYYENFTYPFGVNCELNFMCICELNVIEHFIKIKSNAIGFDEIHPIFVKALLPKLLPHFCYLFNTIIRNCDFPVLWKKPKIIPIPKSPNEYRRIALPFLSKVFESILQVQINKFFTKYNLINVY